MLLMLKVATLTKSLSVTALSGCPKMNKRVRCSGPHYFQIAAELSTNRSKPPRDSDQIQQAL